MRVLIVSYYFAPQNAIGAVRPTKLAKYLTRMGCEVTVICGAGMNAARDPMLQRDMRELHDVRALREWNPLRDYKARRAAGAAKGGAGTEQALASADAAGSAAHHSAQSAASGGGLKHRVLNALYLYLWVLSDRSFERLAKRELHKLQGTFDAVFSTYAPLSVHAAAREAKRMGLAPRWIADFRDEVNVSFRWMERYRERYMRMLRRDADVLSAVSDGFLEMMNLADTGRVLSNGFDREDAAGIAPAREKGDARFRAVYCGQLREGRRNVANRDIRPFFNALRRLSEEGVCAADELCLVYAGDESALFRAYAEECGLGACVEDHGRVTRDQSLALQAGADALLMASWNLRGQTGILTGKLFEYMMMDKPIICCMAGDLPHSELKTVLERTGMGFCHEQAANGADDEPLLCYLRGLFTRRRSGEPLRRQKNEQETEKFAYPALAAELAGWMKEKSIPEQQPVTKDDH